MLLNAPNIVGRASRTSRLIDTRQLLIDSFAIADRIYVETDGDDENGNGTIDSPYATLDHANSQASSGQIIILGEGNFDVAVVPNGNLAQSIFGASFNNKTVVGQPNKTIISHTNDPGQRDFGIFGTTNVNSFFHYLTIERNNGGRTTAYSVALLCHNYVTGPKGAAYNCVLKEMNANGRLDLIYNNNNNGAFRLYNSTIIGTNWSSSPYSGDISTIEVMNCAATGNASYGGATQSNNVNNVTLDTDYRIISSVEPFSISRTWGSDRMTNTSSVTFTSVDFGSTIPDTGNSKDIYYVFSTRGGSGSVNVTIDGQNAELVETAEGGGATFMQAQVWRVKDIRKTSGNIYLQLGAQNFTSLHTVYSVMNGEIFDSFAVASATLAAMSATLDIEEGGAVFALNHVTSNGNGSISWTGLNEVDDFTGENNVRSSAINTDMTAETGRSIQAASTYTNTHGNVLVGVSIKPTEMPSELIDTEHGVYSGPGRWGGISEDLRLLDYMPQPIYAISLRKLNSSYMGPAIEVRRASDNSTQNIDFTTEGDLDTASIVSFCGSSQGFVRRIYDQSGNGNDFSNTGYNEQQPKIYDGTNILTVNNGKPSPFYDGIDDHIWAGNLIVNNNPKTMVSVLQGTDGNGHIHGEGSWTAGHLATYGIKLAVLNNKGYVLHANYDASRSATGTTDLNDGNTHSLVGLMKSQDYRLIVDNALEGANSVSTLSSYAYTAVSVGASKGRSGNDHREEYEGYIPECIYWEDDLKSSLRLITQDVDRYWK